MYTLYIRRNSGWYWLLNFLFHYDHLCSCSAENEVALIMVPLPFPSLRLFYLYTNVITTCEVSDCEETILVEINSFFFLKLNRN